MRTARQNAVWSVLSRHDPVIIAGAITLVTFLLMLGLQGADSFPAGGIRFTTRERAILRTCGN
jgi:hypothetical protein